jgi:hypothetical protein
VWKLCQGLASLSVNDKNKGMITAQGGVEILAEVSTAQPCTCVQS